MAEVDAYLSRIFGDGAVAIETENYGDLIRGYFDWENEVVPLSGVVLSEDGRALLTVTEEHLSGHFLVPQTMPAYRMLEFCAMTGGGQKVHEVFDARFARIVHPGDLLTAFHFTEPYTKITREWNHNFQDVARMDIKYSEQGLKPHAVGVLLEIAAQTAVANIVRNIPYPDEVVYPLIVGVGDIVIYTANVKGIMTIEPTQIVNVGESSRFTANVIIYNDYSDILAKVNAIQFVFASANMIATYDAFGRNFV